MRGSRCRGAGSGRRRLGARLRDRLRAVNLVLLGLARRSLGRAGLSPAARGWLLVAVGLVPVMVAFLAFAYGLERSATVHRLRVLSRHDALRRGSPGRKERDPRGDPWLARPPVSQPALLRVAQDRHPPRRAVQPFALLVLLRHTPIVLTVFMFVGQPLFRAQEADQGDDGARRAQVQGAVLAGSETIQISRLLCA